MRELELEHLEFFFGGAAVLALFKNSKCATECL